MRRLSYTVVRWLETVCSVAPSRMVSQNRTLGLDARGPQPIREGGGRGLPHPEVEVGVLPLVTSELAVGSRDSQPLHRGLVYDLHLRISHGPTPTAKRQSVCTPAWV